jgi:hypothetical protein
MKYDIPAQTLKPYPEGSSSIYDAGIANRDASVNQQMRLINTTGGKRYKKGGQNSVPLPPFSVPYNEVGAGDNTATANYKNGIQTILASNENARFDSCIGQGPSCTMVNQTAGSKRRKYTNKRRKYTNKRRKHTNKRRKHTNKRRKHTNKKH